jgi:hypothetical protein
MGQTQTQITSPPEEKKEVTFQKTVILLITDELYDPAVHLDATSLSHVVPSGIVGITNETFRKEVHLIQSEEMLCDILRPRDADLNFVFQFRTSANTDGADVVFNGDEKYLTFITQTMSLLIDVGVNVQHTLLTSETRHDLAIPSVQIDISAHISHDNTTHLIAALSAALNILF